MNTSGSQETEENIVTQWNLMEPRLYFDKVGLNRRQVPLGHSQFLVDQCPLRYRASYRNMGSIEMQWNQGSILTERGHMEHKGHRNIARPARNQTLLWQNKASWRLGEHCETMESHGSKALFWQSGAEYETGATGTLPAFVESSPLRHLAGHENIGSIVTQ